MDKDARIAFLERRCESLSGEKDFAIQALDAAATLGNFESSYSRHDGPEEILKETALRVGDMLPMRVMGFYLVDEKTYDFELTLQQGELEGFSLESVIAELIKDHSFALALTNNKPTFYSVDAGLRSLLLHPISTQSRTRGMLVGLLDQEKNELSDITLALLTIIMNASAHALENLALNLHFKEIRDGLEKTVEIRTREVRQAYDQVRLILDSVQAGVVVISTDNFVIQDINPAGCRILGLEREDIVGKECFERFCPAQRGACPVRDLGKTVENQERLVPTTDGRQLFILKSAVRTKIDGLDVIIESFVDLSEQKKLSQLREDVDRIMRHDLKAPLSGIISVPDLLLNYESFGGDERELLTMVKDSGLKMLNMINFSLDLFKMETGTYKTAFDPVDVAVSINQVLRDMDAMITSKNLVVHVTLDGKGVGKCSFFLLGEKLLFYSLFSNLVKNAIEASPLGAPLTISLESGEAATIRISNVGEIPEDMRERFFEKYATSGKFGGTGLGTYSAKLIIENLGGEISFSSESGLVVILIRLPQSKEFQPIS